MDWRVGSIQSLAAHQHFFVFKHFKMTSIDKNLGYKVVDLFKRIKFCTEYFLKKVVIAKVQRVEKRDGF